MRVIVGEMFDKDIYSPTPQYHCEDNHIKNPKYPNWH